MKAVFDIKDPEAFVWSWVLKFQGQAEMEPEDLKQEGFLAFAEAMASYQPERGTFATYAGSAIKNRLIYILEEEKMRRRGRGRKDSEEVSLVSLDEPIASGGDPNRERYRHEVVGEEDPGFARVDRRQLHAFVAKAARNLSSRSKEIINRKFVADQTLAEIGEVFDLNRERVRQILHEDLGLLKDRVERVIR